MQKLKKIFSPRRITIFLSIILLFVSIAFMNIESQSQTQGIVTSIAVDYVDEEVQVACSILTPTQGTSAKSNMYKANASTLTEAVELIGLQIGKVLGFAQCDVVALGSNILEYNVVDALDFFIRTKKVGRNVLLLSFEGKVEDFIQGAIYLDEELSLTLSQILSYNKEYLLAIESNLENFYMGCYGDSGISMIPKLVLTENEQKEGIKLLLESASPNSLSQNVEPGGSSSSSSASKTMYLVNDGTTAVLKNGVLFTELSPSDIRKLNLFISDSKYGSFKVEGVTDEIYNNASVVMNMEEKRVLVKYRMKDGKPILQIDTKVYIKVEEIMEQEKNTKLLKREDALITKTVQAKLITQIENDLKDIFKKCQDLKIDCLEIYSNFNKYHYKTWKGYIESLSNKDDYLSGIDLEVGVEIAQYL